MYRPRTFLEDRDVNSIEQIYTNDSEEADATIIDSYG